MRVLIKGGPGRRAFGALLGASLLAATAGLSGCGNSDEVHRADPEGAAKTLLGDSGLAPVKPIKNKRLQSRIEEDQREIAKHPKIH
ncbi:MAG: hypothetical protein ABS79_00320 [Planctomycetes bacterium SCN 63-9]|nr:MAG: hypothetical protein ABS79_00320 [Planctomycetes bacterium SCN 63-9]